MTAATTFLLTGCTGSIHTAPLPSSTATLTPNPPHIYIAPFDTSTGKWLVGRDGFELVSFKQSFQSNFEHQLQDRLMKLAPTEERWVDDLPDHGWLVAGEFITVFQGSRALRTLVGAGEGETTFQTNVYVYDLSISKTQYILSFRTGVPDAKFNTGAGSGSAVAGLTAGVEPISTLSGMGAGLKLDTTRTAREIAAVLAQYIQ
jgi:hypothetical protein